ncbi:MAG: hypothetical protein U5K54_25460 [Cytophagales bacterium]|nr:hypothetical protein [Cytophagales bacterium]
MPNARVASYLGTLQAGFTNFHYLREVWKTTTEQNALIGVGMTGIASGRVAKLDLNETAKEVKHVNVDTSSAIGIQLQHVAPPSNLRVLLFFTGIRYQFGHTRLA